MYHYWWCFSTKPTLSFKASLYGLNLAIVTNVGIILFFRIMEKIYLNVL